MKFQVTKRSFLGSMGAAGLALLGGCSRGVGTVQAETFEISKSPEVWRKTLTAEQYAVLREEDTERAGSSPLNLEKRQGTYACAGCELPVFSSSAKFESGTGWPSFTSAIDGSVGLKEDNTLFTKRTEVHCRRCGGHLGHVFDDGPAPTGKRFCMNGIAMKFVPATA